MKEPSQRIVVHLCSIELFLSDSIDNDWAFAATYVRWRYSYAHSRSSAAADGDVILEHIFRMPSFHVNLSFPSLSYAIM